MKASKTLIAILVTSTLSLAALIIFFFIVFPRSLEAPSLSTPLPEPSQEKRQSLFSWEDEPYLKETKADFYAVLEYLKITDVYQYFSDKNLYSEPVTTFLNEMAQMGKRVYYLTGNAEWGTASKPSAMKLEIDKVIAFNQTVPQSSQLKGIVLDVEPYLTDEWDQDEEQALKKYIQNMQSTYDYAKEKGLEVVLCIPYWYDSSHPEELEALIAKCCDVVSVMNYNRRAEQKSIQAEVEYAQQYNKQIECIFEFQEEGKHSLTENETYYNAGLESALESYEKLYDHFGYKKLNFSYHYYDPILERLQNPS